jgi:hypothetical protein
MEAVIFDKILEHIIVEDAFDLHYAVRTGRMSRDDLFGAPKLPAPSAVSAKQSKNSSHDGSI